MTDAASPAVTKFKKIAQFKNVAAFKEHLSALGLDLPCDERVLSSAEMSPLAESLNIGGFSVGNRWCVHPMEGWDGTRDGRPTEYTLRRWQHFGQSGAKLIWGGEAFAVQADGRANPNQLAFIDDERVAEDTLRQLLSTLLDAHRESFGRADDLLIGLQLTHSGRFSKPSDQHRMEPKIAYHHPLLDRKLNIAPTDDSPIIADDYLDRLIERYITVAKIAQRVGFHFVDVKHCHGYLGHELLSGFTRPGKFGSSFENRTRFARQIIAGIQSRCPGLMIGVRLSAIDMPPFLNSSDVPIPYQFGFGVNPQHPTQADLGEPIAFIKMLSDLGVKLINVTCGSPYYNPHIQRPAIFPPSDGYQPPEDPLVGVHRQIALTRDLKAACPGSFFVGSGYSYLQEYLPHVAQAAIRNGWTDFVGLGRIVLSYWDLPADSLAGRALDAKRYCRTFSDCTTAPRNGIISGCYPLDPYYKNAPEHVQLKTVKSAARAGVKS
jgi:2,4-dienoyl-CoA reductase-like NADH-dependent reductase (Old Yellow Enzyme family)